MIRKCDNIITAQQAFRLAKDIFKFNNQLS